MEEAERLYYLLFEKFLVPKIIHNVSLKASSIVELPKILVDK